MPARELERAVWSSVAAWLSDPDRFEAGVAEALAAHAEQEARRESRLTILDAAMAALQAQLVALSLDAARQEAAGTPAIAGALCAARAKVERELAGTVQERERLVEPPSDQYTAATVARVRAFAAKHGAALSAAAPAPVRAAIVADLGLAVTVRQAEPEEAGVRLTPRAQPVVVTWQGAPGVSGVVDGTLVPVDTNVDNRVREVRLSFLAG